jgi:predicted glycosyltransferase
MDEQFSGLQPVDPGRDLGQIKKERTAMLLALFAETRPDLLLLELYPFGRNAFSFELLPLLEAARKRSECRVACSVRDILVDRDNAKKFEQRVIDRMKTFFDLLLIHGDPRLIRLDETFSRMAEITVPTAYTGYICQPPRVGDRQRIRRRLGLGSEERLIVVSAGSGSVGESLLTAAAEAFDLLEPDRFHMQIFTGPYLDPRLFEKLSARSADRLVVHRFSDDFPAWLAAADLSLSMGGYNTTMNVVAAGCRGLVLPFSQNHEQRLRGSRLEPVAALQLLSEEELEPSRLAHRIRSTLRQPVRQPDILLDGAARTAKLLTRLARGKVQP